MKEMKCYLAKIFEIKELGQLKYFLGIEVAHSKKGLFISKRKYTLDFLGETGMLGCKPSDIPMDHNQKFREEDGDRLIDACRCKQFVGQLIYLSMTRCGH